MDCIFASVLLLFSLNRIEKMLVSLYLDDLFYTDRCMCKQDLHNMV